MKRFSAVFVGNRVRALEALLSDGRVLLCKVFFWKKYQHFLTEELHEKLRTGNVDIEFFTAASDLKKSLVEYLHNNKQFLDFLFSAGCQCRIPLEDFDEKIVFLNSHPGALPMDKGRSPFTSAILFGHKLGITLHLMTPRLDDGEIISQVLFDATPDLSVRAVYSILWDVEYDFLKKEFKILFDKWERGILPSGRKQTDPGSYYTHKESRVIELAQCTAETLSREIRATDTRAIGGVVLQCHNGRFRCYSGREITNKFFYDYASKFQPGEIISHVGDTLLVRCADGVFFITDYESA